MFGGREGIKVTGGGVAIRLRTRPRGSRSDMRLEKCPPVGRSGNGVVTLAGANSCKRTIQIRRFCK